jgi:ceramide glucosyltransferase
MIPFLAPLFYQCLAVFAALRHLRKRRARTHVDAISVLKPLRGLDPNTYEAFVSQIQQNYPEFEILFGVADAHDPAAHEVQLLQQQFPDAPIRLVVGTYPARNGKVGVLMHLAQHARYPVWLVNDSDIKVDLHYLSEVIAPLADERNGVVTCLYRVRPHNLPAAWEAFGIATDFMPSTLVAQLVGVREFGLGSTLAFRAADLKQAGGFAALADYIADDYQLAKRITGLGKRAVLSTYVVETSLAGATWTGIWRHQLRWARTIRLSKGAAYLGLPIAHAGLWALVAALLGKHRIALLLAGVRTASALISGGLVLRSPWTAALSWLAPAWDLYSFAVWLASYAGRGVQWRDRVLTIDAQGRISEPRPGALKARPL